MRKAFKYRIYLTKGQRRILEQQLEECRWVYNETLAYRKRAYEAEQVVMHRSVEGTPKTVTLTRSRTGKWYVTLSCETTPHPLPPTEYVTGVDVGLASFATLSNGWKIDNPRFYRPDQTDL